MVLLAAEFMKEAKPYVEDGVHPHNLIRSYRSAGNMVRNTISFLSFEWPNFDLPCKFQKLNLYLNLLQAIQRVKELAVSIEGKSLEEKKTLLAKCAATTLSSKLICGEKEFFASMVVDAVLAIGHDDRLNLIGIKKVISCNCQFPGIFAFLLLIHSLAFQHARDHTSL